MKSQQTTAVTETAEEKIKKENIAIIDAGFAMDETEVHLLRGKVKEAVEKLKHALVMEVNERHVLSAQVVAGIGKSTKKYLLQKDLDEQCIQTTDVDYQREVYCATSSYGVNNIIPALKHGFFSIDYKTEAVEYLIYTTEREKIHKLLEQMVEARKAKSPQQPTIVENEDDISFEAPDCQLRQRRSFK